MSTYQCINHLKIYKEEHVIYTGDMPKCLIYTHLPTCEKAIWCPLQGTNTQIPPSSWLDPSLSWPSRPDPSLPLLLLRRRLHWSGGRRGPSSGHPDQRRHMRCAGFPGGAPRWPDTERIKKVHEVVGVHFCVTPPTVDARTSTTSTFVGYHLHGVHTDLYSSHNIRTLTTLRGDFSSSPSTFDPFPVWSFAVLPL
jgi:hypothetical protein